MPPFCPFRYSTGFGRVNRPFESLGDEKFGAQVRFERTNRSLTRMYLKPCDLGFSGENAPDTMLRSTGPEFRWTFLWEHLKEKMF
jgi:hypothetical protein